MQLAWDVVVVGLGAMGSAALYQCSMRSGRVLGIDRFAPPHDRGSSHGDTRITRQAIGEGRQYVPLALRSREIWHTLERETGGSLYMDNGVLIFGREGQGRGDHGAADFLAETRRSAEEFGIAHEVLGHVELRRRFPQFSYVGDEVGYYEPGGGYLRPEQCIAANLDCARRNGAELCLNQRVTAIDAAASGDGVTLRCTGQTIHASRVIVATGAWISQLLPATDSHKLRVCRQTLHWFPIRADPATYAPKRCPVFVRLSDADTPMVYGFPAVDGPRGGLKLAREVFEHSCDPDQLDRFISAGETEDFRQIASRFLPLADKPLRQAVCMYTLTADFGFLIDRHPLYPQVILASACSGHGFKHSAAIGEILAELALEDRSRVDISAFSYSRFARA
jgi:sarcosine oxidase